MDSFEAHLEREGQLPLDEAMEDETRLEKALAPVYRERAHLVAYLASRYPSVLVHQADTENPDWPVLFVDLPTGQASWHISPDDLDLFGHVKTGEAQWDGHSTEEKYQRLRDVSTEKGCRHCQEVTGALSDRLVKEMETLGDMFDQLRQKMDEMGGYVSGLARQQQVLTDHQKAVAQQQQWMADQVQGFVNGIAPMMEKMQSGMLGKMLGRGNNG